MADHFHRESLRADRLAKRARRIRYQGGVRATVALGAWFGSVAFVVGSYGPVGYPHTARGLIAAGAIAGPVWLFALWMNGWREPRLAPYTLILRGENCERTLVREYADDVVAASWALAELGGDWRSVMVGRGTADDPLFIGVWTIQPGGTTWTYLVPGWSLYRRPRKRNRDRA